MRTTIKDTEWIRQSFLLPKNGIDVRLDAIRRVHTTASYKYTDTTIGGNFALNSLPQFTRFADLKHMNAYKQSKGMGRYYSEAIDDHAQLIHVRLGMPKFNSLTRFFGDFYSVEASTLARTGRTTSVFYDIGTVIGGILTIPLAPFLLAGKMIRFFFNMPASRYYYLKPAMPLYWNAVSSIVNGIAVNMGIIPRVGSNDQKAFNDGVEWSDNDRELIRHMLPDVIRADGGIDIYAVSTRAQRLANAFNDALDDSLAGVANKDLAVALQNKLAAWKTEDAPGFNVPTQTKPGETAPPAGSGKAYLLAYLNSPDGTYDKSLSPNATENDSREQGWIDKMGEFFTAERKMGSDFVTFRVDHTGSVSESFSNSAGSSGIAETINNQSASARTARFNVADGNISDSGIGKIVGGFLSAAKDSVAGIADKMSISGIAALAGSAFVDIPDVWQSSSADVGRSTFTIPLRAPYGHDYSRLQNLVVPMAALLAMCLPLSAGKQSYTAPFILELFNQGRTQIRLGMVESLTFTRGVGETSWLKNGKYMGVDCNITFVDLSKVVHMPLNASFGIGRAAVAVAGLAAGALVGAIGGNAAGGAKVGETVGEALLPSSYDEDNKYTDYLAVLGSLPLEAQINTYRKFKLRLTQQSAEFNAWTSPAHLMNYVMGGITGDVLKAVSMATARQ